MNTSNNVTLLSTPDMRKDESLESWLEHLAYKNWYKSSYVIERLIRDLMTRGDELKAPQLAETYEIISQITRKPVYDIYQTTINSFASDIHAFGEKVQKITLSSGQVVPIISNKLRMKHCWGLHDIRYCPRCLGEAKYHRKSWYLKGVTVCLDHKCLLLKGCPNCEHSRLRIKDIVAGRCRKCETDLTKLRSVDLRHEREILFAQENIQSWLGLRRKPIDHEKLLLRLSMEASSRVMYQMLMDIHHSLEGGRGIMYGESWSRKVIRRDSYSNSGYLDVNKNHRMMMTAFQSLLSWPKGFYKLLDECKKGKPHKNTTTIKQDIGSLYKKLEGKWLAPQFAFVQKSFDNYLLDNYTIVPAIIHSKRYQRNPELGALFPYIPISEATRILKTTPATIKRLVKMGKIATDEHVIKRKSRKYLLVSRKDVMELQRVWEAAMTLDEVAELLGISTDVIKDLMMIGNLNAVRGPDIDKFQAWIIDRESVEQLNQRVFHAYNLKDFSDATLAYATQILSRYGYTAAKLIQLVLEGQVKGYWGWNRKQHLRDIRINLLDIKEVLEAERLEFPFVGRVQIAKRMNTGVGIVRRWAVNGLLPQGKRRGVNVYFAKEDVDAFVASHIYSDEAAEILQVGQIVVQKWCRKGRLNPVSGPSIDRAHRYLLRRDEVEKLMPENRLTAPQLAERIGISRNRMVEWIKEGKIKPFSGPTVDSCKHYLFLKSEVAEFLASNPH